MWEVIGRRDGRVSWWKFVVELSGEIWRVGIYFEERRC